MIDIIFEIRSAASTSYGGFLGTSTLALSLSQYHALFVDVISFIEEENVRNRKAVAATCAEGS